MQSIIVELFHKQKQIKNYQFNKQKGKKMYRTTFKDFMEDYYKKPYDQIPKKELMEHAKELFGFGLSKDDFNDDGSDIETLKNL